MPRKDNLSRSANNKNPDTIVATATAAGKAAIGIVRMSGPASFSIASSLIQQKLPRKRAIKVCNFYAVDGTQLDQGITISFISPNSFSGEDLVELHVHGNPLILDNIVAACLANGARHAEAGEFSRRAYQNGKVDLTQAESIADVINSDTEISLRAAMRSLSGDFSQKVSILNDKIMQLRVYIEAALDFPTEEIDLLQDKESARQTEEILQQLRDILEQARQGLLIQEELNLVILGKPNAGKSSLMNILCRNDRAIVSEDAGTTRDFLSEKVNIQGMSASLTDTAGIRSPRSAVESEGIERSWHQAKLSDIIICIYDALEDELDLAELSKLGDECQESQELKHLKHLKQLKQSKQAKQTNEGENIKQLKSHKSSKPTDIQNFAELVKHLASQGLLKKTIFIANKLDLLDSANRKKLQSRLSGANKHQLNISSATSLTNKCLGFSVKSGEGMEELMAAIVAKSGKQGVAPQFTARKRHIESLAKALNAVEQGHKQLLEQGAGELFAEDLKLATICLDEILGKTTTDDLLDRIFSEFCLGK
ncbi:MAG: tRNA uridine-5-carboxymethylaminomethyl(34) synthesis GTPase MnmE [Candidatus Portiera sp.]|nr:tRNA uridine-5-carboxymethylaminomethyl(34) synthesis GTPase MnmE [Portiera sp.]